MQRIFIALSALAVLAACEPAAKDVTVAGEMTYTEQIKLPPTATAHIELTSPQFDEPTVKLFSQDIAAPGSPIPFSVTVPGKSLPETGNYQFEGYVKAGDRYLFGTGKVDILRDDLGKPLNVVLHYAPPLKHMFKCGPENSDWYEVAFDLTEATIRNINSPTGTKLPMTVPGEKPTYTNGAYTIVGDAKGVTLGRGKAAPVTCVTGKP
jgi:uncharacterized lipoprotein YbaY